MNVLILSKIGLGHILGNFFTYSSGHPGLNFQPFEVVGRIEIFCCVEFCVLFDLKKSGEEFRLQSKFLHRLAILLILFSPRDFRLFFKSYEFQSFYLPAETAYRHGFLPLLLLCMDRRRFRVTAGPSG
jgi:hypothetical protein